MEELDGLGSVPTECERDIASKEYNYRQISVMSACIFTRRGVPMWPLPPPPNSPHHHMNLFKFSNLFIWGPPLPVGLQLKSFLVMILYTVEAKQRRILPNFTWNWVSYRKLVSLSLLLSYSVSDLNICDVALEIQAHIVRFNFNPSPAPW